MSSRRCGRNCLPVRVLCPWSSRVAANGVPVGYDAIDATPHAAPMHRRRSLFQELAKKFSECGSAKKGGDLGMFRRGKMSAAFELAAFNLDVHELSKTVASSSGVHLIYRVA